MTRAVATQSVSVMSPRDRIVEKARQVVLGYAAAKKHWNPASSLSALLRQMQREYEGRFLYELIQNAYDAHPSETEGDIIVLLDLDEGEHGVLYVANSGLPFTEQNFEAICELAQSDKAPDESIGNKGVGFKSVLQICEWPEIYSAREPGEDHFSGYCFTFARHEQYLALADGDADLAAEMREDVAPYFLPVPLDDQPARISEFGRRGLATAIRLPIKSRSARDVAIERIAQLLNEDVPVHLFLERLRSLELIKVDSGSESATTLRRESIEIEDPASDPEQRFEYVDLGPHGNWFITSRRMAAQAMREAIAASVAEDQLDESWATWSQDSWVSVAVRTDGHEVLPRLYTFLPMERDASAPLHGHIHAPFSTMLARTSVSEQVVLNARLLDCAARATAAAVLSFRENDDVLPEAALVDLLAWHADHYQRVTASFEEADVVSSDLEVVPIEPLPDGRCRGALQNTYRWSRANLTLLDRSRLARDAGAELIAESISGERLERLEGYCTSFFDVGFDPDPDLRAEWVETVAKRLHERGARPRTWDRFYADLAGVFESEADALRGRSVLLGDDGRLHSSPPDDESDYHPLVFFPPARERTDEDEEVDSDVDLKPPATLRNALVLMSEQLTWTRQDGSRRRTTPARMFLERNKLVRRFKTVDLLEHIGRALARDRRAALSADALRFAYGLYVATRSLRQRDLRSLGLRVPTRSGWRAANEAVFSPGWDTALARPLAELIERGSSASEELVAVGEALLKDPSEWPAVRRDIAGWRTFLAEIGVRDGLWPRPVPHGGESYDGSALRAVPLARRFRLAEPDLERWPAAVASSPGWAPNHPHTPYRPREAVSVLPGQGDYEAFDHRTRALYADLVAAGLTSWADGALAISWYRFRHARQPDERTWPSPISAFLRDAPWVPISDPGQRREESFVAPRQAWFYAESRGEETPYFSPLVAARVRRSAATSDRATARLRQLGMGDWEEPQDALRLLGHLAGLVETAALPETGVLAFRRAYTDVWSRAVETDAEVFADEVGDLPVVVSRAGELKVIRPSDDGADALYLVGEEASLAARIVAASDLPVLTVNAEDEGRIRALLEAVLPGRLLTVDELEIDVVTDGGSFTPDGSGELLVQHDRSWIEPLIALVLETKRGRTGQLGPLRRREVAERLLRVRVVKTSAMEMRVGGVAVEPPERHRRVAALDDERHPTLILASSGTEGPGLDHVIAMARPLCELLGITQYEDPLLLALERLQTRGCEAPTDDDFARVLEIGRDRVAEVRSHIEGSADRMLRLIVPVLAYHLDVSTALEILESPDAIVTEDDLRRALSDVASELPDVDRVIAASREAESPSSVRHSLGLDYGRFNAVLHKLPGYEPVHNRDGHAQAMAHYIEANRSRLSNGLRSRYLSAFRDGTPLDEYVRARTLDIAADPAWLDAYDLPPDALLEARVESWLAGHGPAGTDRTRLRGIDVVRKQNHDSLSRVAEVASRVVPAWARKHRSPLPDLWTQDAPTSLMTGLAVEAGVLDFEVLDDTAILAWLARVGLWPEAMPTTTSSDELGLSAEDLESESDVQERERQERLRKRRVLRLDDVEVSAEAKDYGAIYRHVSESLRDETLATRRTAQLEPLPETSARRESEGSRSGGGRQPRDDMSPAQRSAIGLVGETIAYAWLNRHYRDVCSPASWVSTYRETIGEPAGDDSLGYDFKITLKQTTLYFEVKATSGSDSRFELGESEVRKASECARRRRDDYRILFITNALSSDLREIHVLRNPMDPANDRYFGFPGAGLICTFRLA